MNIVIFFYNMLIMTAFIANCVMFAILYKRKRSRTFLYISIMFLLFILDNLLLYMSEFLPEFAAYYSANRDKIIYFENILGFAIAWCYFMILTLDEQRAPSNTEAIIWVILLILIFTFTALCPRAYAKLALRILFSGICVGVFLLAYLRRIKEKKLSVSALPTASKHTIGNSIVLAALILQITETIERFLKFFNVSVLTGSRCISVEILSVLFSAIGFFFAFKELLPKSTTQAEQSAKPLQIFPLTLDFTKGYHLTNRETEVLNLLISGLSNADIGKAMFISEGTAKTHIHNIYQKLGVNSRFQLMNLISASNK